MILPNPVPAHYIHMRRPPLQCRPAASPVPEIVRMSQGARDDLWVMHG